MVSYGLYLEGWYVHVSTSTTCRHARHVRDAPRETRLHGWLVGVYDQHGAQEVTLRRPVRAHVEKQVSSGEIFHKAPCCAPGWQGTHSLVTSNTRGNSGTNNGRSSGAVDCGVHERVSQ